MNLAYCPVKIETWLTVNGSVLRVMLWWAARKSLNAFISPAILAAARLVACQTALPHACEFNTSLFSHRL